MKKKIMHAFYLFMILFACSFAVSTVISKMVLKGEDFSVWLQRKKEAHNKHLFVERSQKLSGDKILIVTFNLGESGAPLMFLHLAKLLHQKGHSVALLSYGGGSREYDLKKAKIPYWISKHPYYNIKEAEEIYSMFDIVISGRMPQMYVASQEHKFIWWDHGLLDCDFAYSSPDVVKGTALYDLKFLAYQAKDVVFVSELQQNKIAECMDISSEIIHNGINPTGIDLDDPIIKQMQQAKKEGKTVFATVGYIDSIKGQDVLVSAVKLLPPEYLKKTAFFVVGADKNHKYADNLRIQSKSISEIVWTGPILHKKIGGVYKIADVLLVPSQSDTAPLVVQEAAEHSMPSVITNKVGSTFIVEDNKSGFIIPTKDPEALAEKIKFFVDNPYTIEKFGKVARENYDKYSSVDAFISKWENKLKRKLKEVKTK